MAEIYFSGQGTVYAATRNSDGTVDRDAYRDLGNVPSLTLTLETEVLEHKESKTGNRLTDLRIVRERMATLSLTLESFTKDNLMMLLYGTSESVAGAVVSNEAFPNPVAVGDVVALNHAILDEAAAFTVAATAGTPALGTHYSVDKKGGMVTILSLAGLTQPLNATYTHLTKDVVPMFESTQVERFLKFSGLNTANANKGAVVELYRVVFDPVNNFDLINDELGQYELTGSVLYDSTRDADALLGGFGRVLQST